MSTLSDRIVKMATTVSVDNDKRGVLSTGEQIAVAFVLDRMDWLKEWGWSPIKAAERLGPEWLAASAQAHSDMRW